MAEHLQLVDYTDKKQATDLVFLLNNYACDPMGGNTPLSDNVKQHLAVTLSTLPHAFSFIYYIDEQPAGLCNSFYGFSTFACKPLINIHDLAVHANFRGQGIARKLLQGVADKGRAEGCCKVTLEVLSNNIVAKTAYENFGFALYQLDDATGSAQFMELKL